VSKVHARESVSKGELKELRLLNLVNSVNRATSRALENSQILFGPTVERFIGNYLG
jgi:hypothetical protein